MEFDELPKSWQRNIKKLRQDVAKYRTRSRKAEERARRYERLLDALTNKENING